MFKGQIYKQCLAELREYNRFSEPEDYSCPSCGYNIEEPETIETHAASCELLTGDIQSTTIRAEQ